MKPDSSENKESYVYADYLEWPDDERWEIIDGVAYDMTPAPTPDHQRVSRSLCFKIQTFLQGKSCEMFNAPFDILLPIGDEPDAKVKTVVQPDIVVVCDPAKVTTRGCRGAPDWIIEILSPSTAGKDQIVKRRTYERAGVKEYWVCHPTDRIITIYRLRKGKLTYIDNYDDNAELAVECLPGLKINCTEIFPPQLKVVRESPRQYL